jgi:galactose-1-phosphate uridylyltransferase
MIKMNNGSTVFDTLNSSFSVTFKEFAGMGKLITGINGFDQNSTYYWFYYVDNEFAQLAADKFSLHKNSSVLFEFTSENKFIGG